MRRARNWQEFSNPLDDGKHNYLYCGQNSFLINLEDVEVISPSKARRLTANLIAGITFGAT